MAQLVEALGYKPEIEGLVPNGISEIFHRLNPSGRTMILGSTQPLTEMSTRELPWEVKTAGACG